MEQKGQISDQAHELKSQHHAIDRARNRKVVFKTQFQLLHVSWL